MFSNPIPLFKGEIDVRLYHDHAAFFALTLLVQDDEEAEDESSEDDDDDDAAEIDLERPKKRAKRG